MSSKDAKRRGRPTTLVLGNYKRQDARRLYARHKGDTTYLTDEPSRVAV